jgi:hypothetical protein
MSKVTKNKFNLDLLKQCMERDSPKDIQIPEKLNSSVRIQYTCKCGNRGDCLFRYLYTLGIRCHECKVINGVEKTKQTNLKRYGVVTVMLNEEIKRKYQETNTKRYGVNSPLQNKEIKEKRFKTNLKIYGFANPLQNDEVKKKQIETNLKKFGVNHPLQNKSIDQKRINTNMSRYGVNNPLKSKKVQEKYKKFLMDNYGVEHNMQVAEILEKHQRSAFSLKPYTLPSGKEVKIQGYENHALDKLLQTYQEEDLTIGASLVPKIIYIHQQKTKRYYPDIYILKDNLIIEVKSTYTLKRELEKNLAKRRACIEQGYDFKFWIFHRGQLIQEVNRDDVESCILVQ